MELALFVGCFGVSVPRKIFHGGFANAEIAGRAFD
jgi:hypothetical protein